MNKLHTCVDLLEHIEKKTCNLKAMNYRDSHGWQAISTQEMLDSIKHLALGLNFLGFQKGDRIGVLAHSSPNWTIADLAIMIAGGISVPIFGNISDENFIYEVNETQAKIIFFEGAEQWEMCLRYQDSFDIAIALGEVPTHDKVLTLASIMEKGKELEKKRPNLYEQIKASIKPDDVAAIIYTSGSTGVPKGVELTHLNITAALHFDKFNLDPTTDSYLSVLPLAHVFGHGINLWILAWGVSIYYTNDYKNLGAICREVQPTIMVVVPRLLEKMYNKMVEGIHSGNIAKSTIGQWAFNMAKNESYSFFKTLFKGTADHLVYSKLREALGGKLRFVISGGAALNPHLHHFFEEIGIPIYEGWGLTEGCPICVNIPNKNKAGIVGPPTPGQQLKIGSDGEVLVKGDLVMRGYYRNPEATAKAFDKEGWLHTGDRGLINDDGSLVLKGRMKELYKTSTGEYVAPVPLEQALTRLPLIDMAMVVADGRKFTSCLLFPNFEVVSRLKIQQRQEKMSDEEFLHSHFIAKELDQHIEQINHHFNRAEHIHAYRFVMEPLTVERGELTPSMKIRRDVVADKYVELINAMYPQEET